MRSKKIKNWPWIVAALAPYGIVASQVPTAAPTVSFDRDLKPIIESRCLSCHGGPSPKAGLDLSTPDGLKKGGASGALVVAGKPADSLLVQRLKGQGGMPSMPRGFAPLPKAQLDLFENWIAQGAHFAASEVDFQRDVQSIFKAHCLSCHTGADADGGLDLSTEAGVKKGGRSGPLFKAKDPDHSLLLIRLLGTDGQPQMPKGFAPISAEKIERVRKWIASGASFVSTIPQHWAFVAPRRPALPTVSQPNWVRNPIDAFTLEQMEAHKLKPSAPAAPETLIRRLYFDLTGLPPTPAEVDAYVQDKSPQAYEHVVDRLLASPHYGERQARVWLDLARYADTDGYEKDPTRRAWKYRDWVINAFNRNMPYDEFTVEQLAGDMMPGGTVDQKIATGFQRNTMQNTEGGVDQEEAHFEVDVDRVSTTGTVWLGLTVGCARCHDHKYDPISQRDFYQMLAFYGNTEINKVGQVSAGEEKWLEPIIEVPTPQQSARRTELNAQIKSLTARIDGMSQQALTEQAAWEKQALQPVNWTPATVLRASTKSPEKLVRQADGSYLATGPAPDQDSYVLDLGPVQNATALRLEVLPDPSLPEGGPGRAVSGNFILSQLTLLADGKPVVFTHMDASFVQPGYSLAGTQDSDTESGWAVAGRIKQPSEAVFQAPITGKNLKLVLTMNSQQWVNHEIGRFRISFTNDSFPANSVLPTDIRDALAKADRTPEQNQRVTSYFRSVSPTFAPVLAQLNQSKAALGELQSQIPTAMVMRENPTGKPTAYMRERGQFVSKTELVGPSTIHSLPPMDTALPKTRLGLAKWLADKKNPLTARVQVNRIWEQYFGRGIVETSENFGTQSSPPTHPKLLDWLAVEFMDRGWNIKAIHKLIVMSNTYRQSSVSTAERTRIDPQNVWLARGPRFRLEAEAIRDNALAISGMLNPAVGGPSVYPSQPAGVWDSPYSGEQWMENKDANRYRRGLYTFLKRTAPYPAFTAFDATSRESCTVRRIRTNTPLQALALLNDQAYLEAARALATRMTREGGKDPKAQLAYGFRLCTLRRPSAAELQRLDQLRAQLRTRYTAIPTEAKKLAGTAEAATWTMVANVLLNLDETITKQ